MEERTGLVHVYTGFGKGKTTAAFGLAMRALGRGRRVLVVQFLKGMGGVSGEAEVFAGMEGARLVRFADQRHPTLCRKGATDVRALTKSVREGFGEARQMVMSGEYDLVILDEINNCMKELWIEAHEVVGLIKDKPAGVELVLTGRGCPEEVVDAADYVTEMKLIKHPAEKGVKARRGVEY